MTKYAYKMIFGLVAMLGLMSFGLLAACDGRAEATDAHDEHDHAAEAKDAHDEHDHAAEAQDPHAEHDHAAEAKDAHDEHDHAAEAQDPHAEHDHAAEVQDPHAGHDHGGHAHAEGEDLDKPVEELFAAECEHAMKTHACDECRYEVGVVKLPRDLIEQGLVTVGKVGRRDFDSDIALNGEVAFDERKVAHLSPRVGGSVTEVAVDLGERVAAGQTLVVLESIELAEAQAAYLEALAEMRLAQKAYKRQQALREKQITSEREFLEAEQAVEAAGIRTNAARQKLLRLGVGVAAVTRLERTGLSAATGRLVVSAPFAGEVLQLHAVRGEQIEPGAEMLLLGDTGRLWIWVNLYEAQLAAVKRAMDGGGLPVSVALRAWPGEHFAGTLDFVGRVMDAHTRTVKARVAIENPAGKLKPGMFAAVTLGLGGGAGRLAVPQQAILSDDGRDFVFVHHEGDYFVRRAVKIGRVSGGFGEVLDGLAAGQTVAIAGAFLLKSDVLRSKMGEGCAH